jgi:hypothetical protein
MYAIDYSLYTGAVAADRNLHTTAGYAGAAAFGIAVALALPLSRNYQILATPLLAVTAAVMLLGNATGVLAALYILTTTTRYLTRATQLALSKPGTGRPHSTRQTSPA